MTRSILLVATTLWAVACADSPGNVNEELRQAQALLAEEKYDAAYAEYERIEKESGNELAQFSLGLFWKLGWGRDPDPAKAAKWFEKAAAGKIPVAEHYYAEILVEGIHRDADPAEAAKLYERAAQHGHHGSLCALATLYEKGEGVPRDHAKAEAYLRKAAAHGVIEAQVRMGHRRRAANDYAGALHWFRQAAQVGEFGDPEAQFELGVMLRDGLGAEPAHHAAVEWFERAAGQGYTRAYLPAGALFFDHGHEAPEPDELAKAYMWLSAAARLTDDEKGSAEAKKLLKRVLAMMPSDWRADLDKKVDEHFKKHTG